MSELQKAASHIAKEVASGLVITDSQNDLNKYFGSIDEINEHLTTITVPYPLKLSWDKSVSTTKMRVNKQVADSVVRVLTKVLNHYGMGEINRLGLNLYGGAFNKRLMRGSTTRWSTHSWGISIDFNPEGNKLRWKKDKAEFAKPIYDFWWKCWEEEGWYSLGREKNYDFMHVQFAKPV